MDYEVILKIFLSIIIGGAIGYERQFKNRPAGFRTHILVCMGATIVSITQIGCINRISEIVIQNPELAASLKSDVGRLGAQVISGIGFLGAGTIIHEKQGVKGLTTAASLWVVACIGLAIGFGNYYLSILSGVCAVVVLIALKRFENKFFNTKRILKLQIQYVNKKNMIENITEYFDKIGIRIKNIEFDSENDLENDEYNYNRECIYTVLLPEKVKVSEVLKDLSNEDEITRINII